MKPLSPLRLAALSIALGTFTLIVAPAPARAQFGGQPGGMQPGGMGPQMGEEPREEGPAEEAPEEEEKPSDLEPLGAYAGQARRTTQVIELDGYLRLRTDFLHKLHLDQTYETTASMTTAGTTASRTPPFPGPTECPISEARCSSKNLGNGNLRLRLEPTINMTDQVRVLAQVDVLDNLILGSTPDSLAQNDAARSGAVSSTQWPPDFRYTGSKSSLVAKRAWGEVDSEFGSLRFGRMPWHFGRGIAYNNGNCPDCEGGTTVDRILGLTQLYGHQVALAWDYGAQNTLWTQPGFVFPQGFDVEGPPYDLSQRDDVLQLTVGITKLDDERRFMERATQGELMFNYGLQVVYREQGQEVYELSADAKRKRDARMPLTHEDLNMSLTTDVDALMLLPSLWMKLGWKALTVEAEASGVAGRIKNAGPLAAGENVADKRLTLQQMGWVVATELRLYRNAFFLGFETGGATGDQAEDPSTYLNYRWKFTPQPPGDRHIRDFKFSPEYHIDEILFRRIIGTVTNAIYVKPAMTYWLDLAERRQLGLSAAFIYSMAMEKVSTPGNSFPYGVEMNLGLNYRNPADGFYAGITWAVLWPMGALNRFKLTETSVTQDATSAQALRTFLGIRF